MFSHAFTIHDGFRIMDQIHNMSEKPTAIFTGNDQVAAGIIKRARYYQYEVPKQLAKYGPVVMANEFHAEADVPVICYDEFEAGYKGTELFIQKGHHLMAFCCDTIHSKAQIMRKEGFMKALDHPFFAQLMKHMSAEALKHQYKVIVFQTFYQKQNELKVLELLKRKEVDGVMLCSLENEWEDIKKYVIDEIAKLSNVSKTTVSRVLNDHPYVSEEKRKRVLEVIEKLDYIPNTSARKLRSNKTMFLAVSVPHAASFPSFKSFRRTNSCLLVQVMFSFAVFINFTPFLLFWEIVIFHDIS
ncbi:LacI family DNA-binding transcriptional regulator [Bacillus licheniformis]|nr:LacI family DNA-binding transcriptional regulator [Bacillus licheniformis]